MGPKKRDRSQPTEESKASYDHIQSDHELFLQAFEKPTQIYRFLKTRNLYSPIFLQRTLGYMTGRCIRKANTRKGFNFDKLLAAAEAKEKRNQANCYKSEFLQLTFSGYYDKVNTDKIEAKTAEVEASVLKISHKRRKNVSSSVKTLAVKNVTVPLNPNAIADKSTLPTVSFSSDNFSTNGTNSVKSYILKIQVSAKVPASFASTRSPHKMDTSSDLENQGPPRKKLRSSRESGNSVKVADDSFDVDTTVAKTYAAELLIFDKRHRCLLTEADYELALEEEMATKLAPQKQRTWETVSDGKDCIPFEIFTKGPIVKFSLAWTKNPVSNLEVEHQTQLAAVDEFNQNNCLGSCDDVNTAEKRSKENTSPSKRKRIFYQFLYNNNMRQQTEAKDDCRCPWCYLNCLCLTSLLNHLRCCHSRFNFMFVDHPKGGRIDVSINDTYDGSYVGNPQDLHSHIGYAFSRNGPVRRMSVTHILVSRKSKPLCGAMDFLDGDGDCQKTRHSVQGHNRLYYHTLTCRPVRPSEIDVDSEEEIYPDWLRQKTQNMIDEFTDVNEGEKEVMKMWNLHVMHHNYISDYQIPKACSAFVDEYGAEIFHRNLRRNFLLHLVNLCDFGLLRPSMLHRTMAKFLQLSNKLTDGLKAAGQPKEPAGSAESAIGDALSTKTQPCHVPDS